MSQHLVGVNFYFYLLIPQPSFSSMLPHGRLCVDHQVYSDGLHRHSDVSLRLGSALLYCAVIKAVW